MPGLAASWTQDDAKTWTFELVDNAVWHNDEPFTADDVMFSFTAPKEHAICSFRLPSTGRRSLDKHKVRLHLNSAVRRARAVARRARRDHEREGRDGQRPEARARRDRPVPARRNGSRTTTSRCRSWDQALQDGQAATRRDRLPGVGDDSVRLTGLQTGELNWIQRVPAAAHRRAGRVVGAGQSPRGSPYKPDMVMFNCTKPPFDDVRVRQAVAWASTARRSWTSSGSARRSPPPRRLSDPSPWYTGAEPYEGGPDPRQGEVAAAARPGSPTC